METLTHIWQLIAPYVAAILSTVASVITVVIAFVKSKRSVDSKVDDFLKKIDLEKLMNETAQCVTEKGIERVKSCSYTTTIQPLVESELQKVTERANTYIHGALANVGESYMKLVAVLEALAAYFDNSIGVSEQAKAALHAAIAAAKIDTDTLENTPLEISVEEIEKEDMADPKSLYEPNEETKTVQVVR